MAQGKFDIVLGDLFMTLERQKVFDFGYPYFKSSVKAFMKRSSNALDFQFFIKPLTQSAWWTILMFLVSFFVAFLATLKCFGNNEERTEETLAFKILVMTFWIKFVLIFAYYGGAMTTDLTLNDFNVPFKTFGEVGNYKEYLLKI